MGKRLCIGYCLYTYILITSGLATYNMRGHYNNLEYTVKSSKYSVTKFMQVTIFTKTEFGQHCSTAIQYRNRGDGCDLNVCSSHYFYL